MPQLPGRLRLAGLALAALALAGAGCRAEARPPVRLAVLLVVDQLTPAGLDPALPGGIGRLAREGRVFADGVHDHSDTETCPGHAALATGRQPGAAGIPGNQLLDVARGESVYCVSDPAADARVPGAPYGRSPRALQADALGDWLKVARPGARVFAVSGKDRGAIMLGGRHPDGVWWLDRAATPGFVTSAYYRTDAPDWVRRFNGEGGARGWQAGLPSAWEHEDGDPPNGARPDDYAAEIDRFGRTSPHPLGDADPALALERLSVSPFLDQVTLDFARRLVEAEDLGRGAAPDLLAVSLSALDFVGHFYGPESQEARDTLLRIDAWLEDFLAFLEARAGSGGLVVGLSSDHGVLPLPEWLAETGRSACPVRGGRVDGRGLLVALESHLDDVFGADAAAGPWLLSAGLRFGVRRARAQAAGVAAEAVVAEARRMLEAQPVVARVWTSAELEAGEDPTPFAQLYRHSYHRERSGDFAVQPHADCLIAQYPEGTNHGTPYLYDRAVPIVLWGAGVEPGRVRGLARTIDLAPTLATLIGIDPPAGLDGHVLAVR